MHDGNNVRAKSVLTARKYVNSTYEYSRAERQGQPRSEVMALHGFRKYFATTLETEGVNPVYVELLLGHDMGLKNVYSKPTPMQLLEGNGEKC
jgi:integrase